MTRSVLAAVAALFVAAGPVEVSAIPLLLIFQHGKVVRRYEGVTGEATLRADLTALGRN